MTVLVELHTVSKQFRAPLPRQSLVNWLLTRRNPAPDLKVLTDLSLSVQAGETVGIVGKNGSGKSTLMKLIAGILRPSSGSISVHGGVLPVIAWERCFLEDLSVLDNLYLFGALLCLSTSDVTERALAIVDRAGLPGRLGDQMRSFSPGMKARIALALAHEAPAQVVLLDETLSAGDAEFRAMSRELLASWKSRGRAIIHVSHDSELISALSDRQLRLRDGRLQDL